MRGIEMYRESKREVETEIVYNVKEKGRNVEIYEERGAETCGRRGNGGSVKQKETEDLEKLRERSKER